MVEAFFTWVDANDVPFFAVLMAIIGTLLAGMIGFAAGVDLAVSLFRKIKSR